MPILVCAREGAQLNSTSCGRDSSGSGVFICIGPHLHSPAHAALQRKAHCVFINFSTHGERKNKQSAIHKSLRTQSKANMKYIERCTQIVASVVNAVSKPQTTVATVVVLVTTGKKRGL